jgi:hypothetical protein
VRVRVAVEEAVAVTLDIEVTVELDEDVPVIVQDIDKCDEVVGVGLVDILEEGLDDILLLDIGLEDTVEETVCDCEAVGLVDALLEANDDELEVAEGEAEGVGGEFFNGKISLGDKALLKIRISLIEPVKYSPLALFILVLPFEPIRSVEEEEEGEEISYVIFVEDILFPSIYAVSVCDEEELE